jgi:AcrR family transcriptional regulator
MTSSPRPIRSDAARNRELLLDAAEREFAEKGLDASVADIAARAGLGKGTFFRHFATKDDLVAAIVTADLLELNAVGQQLLAAPDAVTPSGGGALLDFLSAAGQRQQRDVSFLMRANPANADVAASRAQLFETVSALVRRAQGSGIVRSDVTGVDVILLMCAPTHVVEFVSDPDPELWKRYLAIVFDGLRPVGAHSLPVPPPLDID